MNPIKLIIKLFYKFGAIESGELASITDEANEWFGMFGEKRKLPDGTVREPKSWEIKAKSFFSTFKGKLVCGALFIFGQRWIQDFLEPDKDEDYYEEEDINIR